MRKIRMEYRILAISLAIAAVPAWAARPAEAQDLQTVVLNVRGMWAEICEWYMEESLLDGLDGIEEAAADHAADTVTIVFDPAEISPERLAAAIEDCPFFRVTGSETHDLDQAEIRRHRRPWCCLLGGGD